jgi:hypothetical protein
MFFVVNSPTPNDNLSPVGINFIKRGVIPTTGKLTGSLRVMVVIVRH